MSATQTPLRGPDLGVCYYPEQWPREIWAQDAAAMVALGLQWVRIAEFAWARIEPQPGQYDWAWLDEAVDVLGKAGLKVILCTPTAAPPKWLVDLYPEILPVDARGVVRKFGARRHYCFSSPRYRIESARITQAVAARYGRNPFVQAWQTDNEYGDHDTIYSYSDAALTGFRGWLADRYGTIDGLNRAWGTAFWSMTYSGFSQIELPNNLVDEPTPSHLMDFTRFSSDQVRSFNKAQVDLLRQHAPGRPITHNFMNQNTDFDHYALGDDIDVASWDVYPLGGLINGRLPDADKARYLRVGDPDQTAFNHDLYRAVGKGRVWVMEQQPGPVNWAAHNPAPADGMVRLWTWLAFAHGVDMVSYFRWRQAPFAQEQFHAGLLLPDSIPDQGHAEVAQVARERALLPPVGPRDKARVALVLDYQSRWASRSLPQGADYRPHHIALDWYAAASRLGVDLDIIGQHSDLSDYDLILAPDLLIPTTDFVDRLIQSRAKVLFGPRSGSKTEDMHIPAALPPGPLGALLQMKVTRVESLPGFAPQQVQFGNGLYAAGVWRESVQTREPVLATFAGDYRSASAAMIGNDKARYLAMLPKVELLQSIMSDTLHWAGVETLPDLGDLRLARRGMLRFAFNFGQVPAVVPAQPSAEFLLGSRSLAPVEVAIWLQS